MPIYNLDHNYLRPLRIVGPFHWSLAWLC